MTAYDHKLVSIWDGPVAVGCSQNVPSRPIEVIFLIESGHKIDLFGNLLDDSNQNEKEELEESEVEVSGDNEIQKRGTHVICLLIE